MKLKQSEVSDLVSFLRTKYNIENILTLNMLENTDAKVEMDEHIRHLVSVDAAGFTVWQKFDNVRFLRNGYLDEKKFGIDKLLELNQFYEKPFDNINVNVSPFLEMIAAGTPVLNSRLSYYLDIESHEMTGGMDIKSQAAQSMKLTGLKLLLTEHDWWNDYRINDGTLESMISLDNAGSFNDYARQLFAASAFLFMLAAELLENEKAFTDRTQRLMSCAFIVYSKGREILFKANVISAAYSKF